MYCCWRWAWRFRALWDHVSSMHGHALHVFHLETHLPMPSIRQARFARWPTTVSTSSIGNKRHVCLPCVAYTSRANKNRPGGGYLSFGCATADLCGKRCASKEETRCLAYSWVAPSMQFVSFLLPSSQKGPLRVPWAAASSMHTVAEECDWFGPTDNPGGGAWQTMTVPANLTCCCCSFCRWSKAPPYAGGRCFLKNQARFLWLAATAEFAKKQALDVDCVPPSALPSSLLDPVVMRLGAPD